MLLATACLLSLTVGDTDLSREVTAQLHEVLASPALAKAKVGVYIKRLEDGRELFVKDPDALLIPASNVKIVTTAAALSVLGPDFRYVTEVFAGPDAAGMVDGDLVVKGYGDPSIVPERLWYLANRIFYAGVREVRGDLVIDDSYFDGSRQANGFEQDRTSNAYMALSGAVSVGFNAIQIHVLPSPMPGSHARVLIDPPSRYAEVVGSVTMVSRGRSYVNVDVVPSGDRSIVRVSGRMNVAESGRGFWRRIDNPPVFAGEVLRTALEQVGVKVRGRVKTGRVKDGAMKVLTAPSPRLAEILNLVNKSSNNFMAEQVALTIGAAAFGAPATWNKAQAALDRFLETDVGLKKGSYALKNGSGLHDVNRFTPRQMVQVLECMFKKPGVSPEFIASMAVAGGSGTLAERMQKTEAAHLLRAKTGTLSNASALSGYVTVKSGETLAFSIIVNDYDSPIGNVWQVQDHMGAMLAGLDFTAVPADEVARQTQGEGALAVP
jgi:serine-type D-Ala-D-Ala carboxypeptidase/endopeptidase (penicillin-binding protein 4)